MDVLTTRRSRIARSLHAILASAVLVQIALSLGMAKPREGHPGNPMFGVH